MRRNRLSVRPWWIYIPKKTHRRNSGSRCNRVRLIYIKRRHTIRDRPVSVCVCMRTVLSIVYGLSCVSAPDRIMHSRSTRVLLVCCLLVKKIQIQLEQFRLRTRITFGHAYEYAFFQINSFYSIRPSDMFRVALFSKNWLIRFIFKIAIVYGREFVEYRSGTLFPIYRVAENVHPCLHEFTYVAPSNCFCFTWVFVDAFRRDAGNKNGVKNLKKKLDIFVLTVLRPPHESINQNVRKGWA